MSGRVRLTIDGRTIEATAGENLLAVARRNGFDIPGLCYHERLTPTGGCRLCLVKVEGGRGPTPACTLQASDGLTVTAFDEELEADRRWLIELLLAEHNCDCVVCEAAGRCELQDLAYRYGLDKRTRRYTLPDRTLPDVDDSSPVLVYDPSKCILCERCVKACDEIQGKEILSYAYRGLNAVVTAGPEGWEASACDGCGECVQLCPTGAIREKLAEQPPREWEMESVQTTCSYCGVGCQIDLWVHEGRIVNVTGSDAIPNFGSTCVKGRFGHDYIQASDRLTTPLVKRDGAFVEATWDEALDLVASRVSAIRAEHGADARFVETPRTDQREGFDQDAFLLEGGRIGRHRPRRLAAEIGVVAATRRIERRRRVVRLEDRRHHRHVRQMRAAREGIVRDEYVPRRHRREPL